ncbi:MAG: hypothetical protein WCW35_04015 [Bacteroidota bacterium]
MKKTRIYLFIIFSSISFFQMDCKDDSPIPPDNKPLLGKRDYTWSIDTIAYPDNNQTLMYDICGNSFSDVYVVGHSDGSSAATMYHYDGAKWLTTKYHVNENGPIKGPIDLQGVYTFSSSDIWAVGERSYEYPENSGQYVDSGLIVHYNGVSWHEHNINVFQTLLAIWGTDSNNVWIGGLNGELYNTKGNKFIKESFPSNIGIAQIAGLNSNTIYIFGFSQSTPRYYSIYNYDGITWSIVDSTNTFPSNPHFGNSSLWVVTNNILYSSGYGGVFQKSDDGWVKVLSTGTENITTIRGNSSNNLFAVGRGQIYHFNGVDWFKYEQFSDQNILWYRTWSDGNVVFIIGLTLSGIGKTVVLRGY